MEGSRIEERWALARADCYDARCTMRDDAVVAEWVSITRSDAQAEAMKQGRRRAKKRHETTQRSKAVRMRDRSKRDREDAWQDTMTSDEDDAHTGTGKRKPGERGRRFGHRNGRI